MKARIKITAVCVVCRRIRNDKMKWLKNKATNRQFKENGRVLCPGSHSNNKIATS